MKSDAAILCAQKGLLMRAVFGQTWTIHLHEQTEPVRKTVVQVIQDLARTVDKEFSDCGLIAAFAPALWAKWTGCQMQIETKVLDEDSKLFNTGGDVLLYIKGPSHETVNGIMDTVRNRLNDLSSRSPDIVIAGKRSDCRIIGGRYMDSISNPNDPISLTEDILIGGYTSSRGGCFGFTQKFRFDWSAIASQTADSQDEMIGRNSEGAVLSQHSTQGHIHRAHAYDSNMDQRKLLRQALPYGTANGHAGREEGLMFVAFCNEQPRFEQILARLLGKVTGDPIDRMMDVVEGLSGGYWYVPAAAEIGVPSVLGRDSVYEDPHWQVRSSNGFMFYNSQDYLHQMGEGRYIGGDPPSSRLLSLLSRTFNHWRDGWFHQKHFPRLTHLDDLSSSAGQDVMKKPVAIRKALANRATLTEILSSIDSSTAREQRLLRIESKELIVGVIPDFTLGRGKEVVPYLSKAETMTAWLNGELNEWSAMGHVVPDYEILVQKGLGAIIGDIEKKLHGTSSKSHQNVFYSSVLTSLRGVQGYLRNWAALTRVQANNASEDAGNMRDVSERLLRLINDPPDSFHDAVQLIYSFHCCLHLVGELTSLGRLDQILVPFLERDKEQKVVTMERAQEIVDCLFLKIGENAFVDRSNIYDYVTYGTTSVCGVGGNFPQGGGINQWVQQITVGGYKALDDEKVGGANDVTMLCLKAARRIPVNAPTLSLRVYKGMPAEYLDEAAKSILSGGAQPILYNDDKLCEGLLKSGPTVTPAWSRNYAADGCYEPMLAGASEFTFNNVAPMLALEQTINQGTTYGAAGPEQLRGLKQTFRSPPAQEIKEFTDLQEIYLNQLEWLVVQCYNTMLNAYGALANVCPSPLLSTLIKGCVDKGRDLTDGGAQFHIIAPLCVGMSNTIDSLFAIKKLVFDPETAATTLPELVNCLINDWGFNMIEPFESHQDTGSAGNAEYSLRFKYLRQQALNLPKWGSGNKEVNALGDWLFENTVRLCKTAIHGPDGQPHPALAGALSKIRESHGSDFEFVVTPGIGTFEGYVGDGMPCGASADGRRNGMPIASDLSPVPAAQDLPAAPAFRNIYQAMKSFQSQAVQEGFSNASPCDMNIEESFPLSDLQRFVRAFAQGEVGGNLVTLTCADLATYQKASVDSEKCNLVRVRMGGWTEFYATMFEAHQDQHQRRQYFVHKDT